MKMSKEITNYIIFGVLTTLINILVYVFLTKFFSFSYQTATVIAWIVAVLFAYYTNKKYVFNTIYASLFQTIKSFCLFVYYRILSLLVDLLVMYIIIEFLYLDDLVTKVIANVVVVIFNYITSKLFIFSKTELDKDT
ncbi:GtrA family protein [Virgibacillus sp. L01]|uniref:GtrA family protein n=1 Tax=Virgibacillus sp. L01 TaxID=3457429 RepID=UPI003FD006AF